ncbi:MAG: alpha/beta hydrolase [Candidatus Hodarchaeales archaeon]
MHGFTASPSEMLPLGNFLHKKGYTVHGVRLAGHGTNYRDLPTYSYNDWFESVENGYFLLKKECETVIPIGISMGALLVLMLIHKYQFEYKFPSLILIAPAFGLRSRFINFVPLISPFIKYIYKGDTVLEYYKEKSLYAYYYYPTKSISEFLKLRKDLFRNIVKIDIKTLIVYGEKDRTISKSKIHSTIKEKFGPNTTEYAKYTRSGHNFTTDPDAEEAFIKILEFINDYK